MAQKRKLHDYENDHQDRMRSGQPTSDVSVSNGNGTLPNHNLADTQNALIQKAADAMISATADDGTANGSWEVAESKKSKKRKKKKAAKKEDADADPQLTFSAPVTSPLRIKDLQALVIYLLADGVAPQWIAIRQAKKISKIVVLMIPGIDKAILESFVDAAKVQNSSSASSPKDVEDTSISGLSVSNEVANTVVNGSSMDTQLMTGLHIVPIKAPGDANTGRLYPPLQGMLISPEPKSKTYTKQDALRPDRTPIAKLVHTSEELSLADFPIHPAAFQDKEDGDLEKRRREETRQSEADGWLDSNVTVPEPQISVGPGYNGSLTQGLEVYAIDCEMVLTSDDKYSLARISVLNWLGKTIIDKHVQPSLPIKDYFTQFSGITPKTLEGVTTTLADIQQELLKILTPNAVLVGHSLESDLNALKITHPFIADTGLLYPHPRGLPLRSSLKFLANKWLKREIQASAEGHDSVEDARAALDLVRLKCEKGPKFGVVDANGESIFSRLARAGRKSAMVDYGVPEKGYGQHANLTIGCQGDEEVTRGIVSVVENDSSQDVNFVWGRLRDLEKAKGWNSDRDRYSKSEGKTATETAEEATTSTIRHLTTIYESLPESAALVIYPSAGDMTEVMRLQEMYRAYQREFKVKKWDELTVQWTDTEAQALRRAFEAARKGWALIGLK